MSIYAAYNVVRTGLITMDQALHVKAMNISGQGADAYKRQNIIITDLPYIDKGSLGTPTSTNNTINPTGLQFGLGVQSAGIYRDFSQGDPINTGNPLDLMIDGNGFMMVNLPDGTQAYTRVGALQLSPTNELIMPRTGYTVVPGITLPAQTTAVNISDQGQVYVTVAGSQTPQSVGQIQLATFFNPSGLQAIGDSMFLETMASGTADVGNPGTNQFGALKQGWREGSNVQAVGEMTDLIQIEKIYDMLTKVLKTGDAMMTAASHAAG